MAGGGEGVIGVSRSPDLTPRERGCLSWAARGMTYDGIAGVLDVSPRTLGQHLASARSKLGGLLDRSGDRYRVPPARRL